jgi:hypothetical protein
MSHPWYDGVDYVGGQPMKKYFLLLVFLLTLSGAFALKIDVQSGTGLNIPFGYDTTNYDFGYQTFNASTSYSLEKVEVWILKEASPTGYISASIYNTNASGQPTTRISISNMSLDGSTLTAGYLPYNFTFVFPVVQQNTKYAIVLNQSGVKDATNFFRWEYGNTGNNSVGVNSTTSTGWNTIDATATGHFNTYGTLTAGNFTISASNNYTGASLTNFTANISGVQNLSTTSGTITSLLLINDTALYNITISSNESGGYFSRTYINQNISSALSASIFQAEILLLPRTFFTNQSIAGGNFTSGSVTIGNGAPFYVSAGNLNFTFNHSSYQSTTRNFTKSALSNTSEYFYVGDGLLNITANNTINNSRIINFNITLRDILSGVEVFDSTTSAGYIEFSTLQNRTYNATLRAPGYATTSALITPNTLNYKYNFSVYPVNSIYINIYDETTGALITNNVSVRFSSNLTEFSNITVTGHLFKDALTPDDYQLQFNSSGYSVRTYTLTVGNDTTQTLNAYLTSASGTTLFTLIDSGSAGTIENVLSTMYRFINGSWVPVESKYSDITGKVQWTYTPNTRYKFFMAKDGYADNVFYLDPILFSTYDIQMEPTGIFNVSPDFDGISVVYAPSSFEDGTQNSFSFIISSPSGSLTNYNYILTFPGGNTTQSGSNAIGGQLTSLFNISGATYLDTVSLFYTYQTNNGARNFTVLFPIALQNNQSTFIKNRTTTYGLLIGERVLIATLIIFLVVGLASFLGQPLAGLGLGLIVFAYMVYIGFLPIWIVLISIFLGLFYLAWKGAV